MSTLMEPISHVRVIPAPIPPAPGCTCDGHWGPVSPPLCDYPEFEGAQEWVHNPWCAPHIPASDDGGYW
jgi:hypothetical protein